TAVAGCQSRRLRSTQVSQGRDRRGARDLQSALRGVWLRGPGFAYSPAAARADGRALRTPGAAAPGGLRRAGRVASAALCGAGAPAVCSARLLGSPGGAAAARCALALPVALIFKCANLVREVQRPRSLTG